MRNRPTAGAEATLWPSHMYFVAPNAATDRLLYARALETRTYKTLDRLGLLCNVPATTEYYHRLQTYIKDHDGIGECLSNQAYHLDLLQTNYTEAYHEAIRESYETNDPGLQRRILSSAQSAIERGLFDLQCIEISRQSMGKKIMSSFAKWNNLHVEEHRPDGGFPCSAVQSHNEPKQLQVKHDARVRFDFERLYTYLHRMQDSLALHQSALDVYDDTKNTRRGQEARERGRRNDASEFEAETEDTRTNYDPYQEYDY